MNKKLAVVLALFGLVALLLTSVMAQDTAKKEEPKHEYVGTKMCKICHKDVYASWEQTLHAHATDTLPKDQKENKECLGCHATGWTAKGELIPEVACEACHGPGSDYKSKSIMEDKEKAIANGLIIPDAKTCERCHLGKAPAFEGHPKLDKFDFATMKAKGVHAMPKKDAEE
jgi:hypothetical protein